MHIIIENINSDDLIVGSASGQTPCLLYKFGFRVEKTAHESER